MFAKMPALLVTVEESAAVVETIQKGCLDSGRIRMEDADSADGTFSLLKSEKLQVQKGLDFIIMVGGVQEDPAEACLKDTHGEQFSTDADKMVVDYLTTIEKIDLKNSPVHNPYVVPGPQASLAYAKSEHLDAAFDVLEKGRFAPKAGAKVRPAKTPGQRKLEKQRLGKSETPVANRIASLKRRRGPEAMPNHDASGKRIAKSFDRVSIMEKAFGPEWAGEEFYV